MEIPQDSSKRRAKLPNNARPLCLPDDPVTLAYIAGIVDGEGCITRRATGYWQIQVMQMQPELIEWLLQFGGTFHSYVAAGRTHPRYSWYVSPQADVRDLCASIQPYLRTNKQKERSARAIDEIARKLNG